MKRNKLPDDWVRQAEWVDAQGAFLITNYAEDKLKQLRENIWQEGIYWRKVNTKVVLYNALLLRNWMVYGDDAESLRRGEENWLATLPSNWKRKKGL